jgi:hypothetical protein
MMVWRTQAMRISFGLLSPEHVSKDMEHFIIRSPCVHIPSDTVPRLRPTPAFSRWLKETTPRDRTSALSHQDAKIAPIQPVG